MLNFLIKKIIKSNDFSKKKNRDKLINLSGILGLIINLSLFFMKIIIGFFANSISIISDSINNLSDSITSIVTIYGSKISAKPADDDHPYGHGRSEYISTMIIGVIVFIIGFELFINSFSNILNPNDINSNVFTITILILSILLKIYMFSYNRKIYKISNSILNKSVSQDALNDVMATSLVLISIVLSYFSNINIDGYVGLIISIIIIKTSIEIFIEIADILMGKQIDENIISKLKKIVLDGKYIKGIHKIEIHEYGQGRLFGSCHVDAPANIDVFSMHSIVNDIEKKVKENLNIDITIHVDPNYLLEKDMFIKIDDIRKLDNIDK